MPYAYCEQIGKEILDISDEIPFDIPDSWEWVRLGCIGDWGSGATPSRTNAEYYNGNIPWLKTGDLNDGIITDIPETISELALQKTSVRLNPVGSVLIAMYGATIGKLGILSIPATTNQACCACLPIQISNKYLFYFLMAHKVNFIKSAEGGAQPNISKEKIVSTLMPVPPIEEQHRIVSKIEELLPYIEKYDTAETKLSALNTTFPEALKKSILQEAVQGKLVPQNPDDEPASVLLERIRAEKQALIKAGKIKKDKHESVIVTRDKIPYEIIDGKERCIADEVPFEIPDNWCWCRIGNIFNTSSGSTPLKSETEYWTNGTYNWVRTTDLNNGILSDCEIKISKIAFDKCNMSLLPLNSVCIAMYGGAGTIGKNALLNFETTINQSVCAIHSNNFCDMKFVLFFFQYYRKYWMEFASGSRKDPNINKVIINNTLFPLPPLEEQHRIVSKIEELMQYCGML